MKLFLCALFLLGSFNSFSQDTTKEKWHSSTFININTIRSTGYILTKKDSLNFVIEGEDTLIAVDKKYLKNLKTVNTRKVSVKYEPKDSLFLETYKNIVFGKNKNAKSTLKIWKDDVKIYFDPSVPELHQKSLMNFAEGISNEIDSLTIRKVDTKKDSNYFIYYLNDKSDKDFEPKIVNKNGGYHVTWNSKQQITSASLKINAIIVKSSEYQIANLKFNLVRTLGYFGEDASLECNSYFSNCPVIRSLIPLDLELLKYHYSYGVYKGTTRDNFEKMHRKMRSTLRQHPNAELYIDHTL